MSELITTLTVETYCRVCRETVLRIRDIVTDEDLRTARGLFSDDDEEIENKDDPRVSAVAEQRIHADVRNVCVFCDPEPQESVVTLFIREKKEGLR